MLDTGLDKGASVFGLDIVLSSSGLSTTSLLSTFLCFFSFFVFFSLFGEGERDGDEGGLSAGCELEASTNAALSIGVAGLLWLSSEPDIFSRTDWVLHRFYHRIDTHVRRRVHDCSSVHS